MSPTIIARRDLVHEILAALRRAGRDIDRLDAEDLAPADEFHVRGREATVELGHGLALAPGMRVLDVGSGLGGPSRLLAATYGCRVVGIDLTEDYCRAARILAERLGLADRVDYLEGTALALPFPNASFDRIYTQHVAMNIADKPRLYAEIARVLAPGGLFGLYDLLQGPGGEVRYPAPWAKDASTSFLAGSGEMRRLLEASGFSIVSWRDTTEEACAWFERATRHRRDGGPPAGLNLLLGPDAADMVRNLARSLREGRLAPVEVICRKP